MDELGKVIREALKEKNMTSADLAQAIGLKPKTVNNVIYGQSKKTPLIRKISAGLGVNLLRYVNENRLDKSQEEHEIDMDKYRHAATIITILIRDEKVFCTQEQLNTLINILYDFLCENPDYDTAIHMAFATGMVKYGLKYLILSMKIDTTINESST